MLNAEWIGGFKELTARVDAVIPRQEVPDSAVGGTVGEDTRSICRVAHNPETNNPEITFISG